MTSKKIKIIVLIVFMGCFIFNAFSLGSGIYNDYQNDSIDYEIKEEIRNAPPDVLEELQIDDINNIDEEVVIKLKNKYFMNAIIIVLVLSLFLAIVEPILLWIILIAIYLSRKKYMKLKLSSVDFSKDKSYYRDVLKEYSPSVLSYIDNFSIDYTSSLLGDLLALEQRKMITINQDNITVLSNEGKDSLPITLKYVFENIINSNLNIDRFAYENMIIKEARSLNLLEDDKKVKSHIKKEILISIIIYIIFIIVTIVLFNNIENINIMNNILLVFVIFFIFFILFLVLTYYPLTKIISLIILTNKLKQNNGIRTSIGEEVNLKLEGLKNFLKDFSILDEKTKEELIIWQDYLIYSVIFNQNTKIVDKYKNVIK